MADAQPDRVQLLLSSDDELLIHVVCHFEQNFLESVGSMRASIGWCFINLNFRIVANREKLSRRFPAKHDDWSSYYLFITASLGVRKKTRVRNHRRQWVDRYSTPGSDSILPVIG